MAFPLTGVVILDLADEPLAMGSRLLADLGAEVVRVESLDGDALRRRGPFVGGIEGVERGLAHLLYNAGKRSVALALARPEAWALVDRLACRAAVVIAPMEQTPLAERFFGEAHIRAVAPSTGVVEAVLRRGSAEKAVADIVGTAAGGMLYLNGYPEDPPNHPAGNLAYKQVSLAAALAAMSLVLEAVGNGGGGRVTVSMQEAVMWTTIQSANENYWHWHQSRQVRHGLANLGGRTVFEAADGRWVSLYQHPPAWGAYANWVVEALGETRFLDRAWDHALFRFKNNEQVTAVTVRLCRSMARDDLVREGQRRGVLVVPVQGATDIADDPHLRERGFFQRVWHDQLDATVETMRAPFISSAYRAEARPAPALGQHSRKVLADLGGFGADEIDRLVASGIVGCHADEVEA